MACGKLASWSYEDLVKKLGEWLRLAKSLQAEEAEIKNRMPLVTKHILEKKRIALMRHLIKQEGYDDHTLADDIERGFSLVGDSTLSSVLPPKLVPATISEEDLHRHSDKASKALRYVTRSSGDDELDWGLWTKKSIGGGQRMDARSFTIGRFTHGRCSSRGFPLSQSGKVRPTDDLSQSQVNSTVNTYKQATVDDPDGICS